MNNLPSAIMAIRGLPRAAAPLPVRDIAPTSATARAPSSMPKMEILPPAILYARPVGTPAAPARDTIELISDEAPDKKRKGRPSKKEKAREARAAASAGIAALLDSEPKKADIREYFENRIKELSDL